jgi:tetratricopeptide (TPR) repeat protein
MEMSMKAITFIVVMSLVVVFASAGFAEKGPDYDQAVKYYDSGNYQESVRIFQEYVKKRPEASAYYRIGYGLYKLGKHREAEGYFQQAYLIDPTFSPESAGTPQKYPVKGMRKTPRTAPKQVQSHKKAVLSGNEEKQSQEKPEAVLGTSASNKVPPGRGQVTSPVPEKKP